MTSSHCVCLQGIRVGCNAINDLTQVKFHPYTGHHNGLISISKRLLHHTEVYFQYHHLHEARDSISVYTQDCDAVTFLLYDSRERNSDLICCKTILSVPVIIIYTLFFLTITDLFAEYNSMLQCKC